MKLVVYMKSGNKIVVRGVRNYEIMNQGDDITSFSIERYWWAGGTKLLVKTLALSQIEAVCSS